MNKINKFDGLPDFVCSEDKEYIVEYILSDDGGCNSRTSPFLMPIGTIFEHNFGTYKVSSIDIEVTHIIVWCDRVEKETPKFDFLIALRNIFN